MAPRVGIVANMQANLVIELLYKKSFFVPNRCPDIFCFDGKILAEYNGLGECMRDYIYLGDRLLAEYQPQSGQVYYYTSDQVNYNEGG